MALKILGFLVLTFLMFFSSGKEHLKLRQVTPAKTIFQTDSLSPYEGPDLEDWYRTPFITDWDPKPYKSYIFDGMALRLLYPISYVADSSNNSTYPLIVYLHGLGSKGPTSDNESQLELEGKFFKNLVDNGTFKGFVLFPQNEQGWLGRDLEKVHKCIEFLIRFKKVDPLRISFRGYSNGADGLWKIIESYPEIVSSAICLSYVPNPKNISDSRFKEIPIWIVQGLKDKQQEAWITKLFLEDVKRRGLFVKYSEYSEAGHEVSKFNEAEKDMIPFMVNANKLNPIIFHQNDKSTSKRNSISLFISSGFTQYMWEKDGKVLPYNNTNYLNVTASGTYRVRIKYNGEWTYWSPKPAVVTKSMLN